LSRHAPRSHQSIVAPWRVWLLFPCVRKPRGAPSTLGRSHPCEEGGNESQADLRAQDSSPPEGDELVVLAAAGLASPSMLRRSVRFAESDSQLGRKSPPGILTTERRVLLQRSLSVQVPTWVFG